jgi:hypothetical protein
LLISLEINGGTILPVKINPFLLLFVAICALGTAQETDEKLWNGIGQVSSFGRPFWADMHSTLVRAEVACATNSPDYDWNDFDINYRTYVFSNLGVDLPIWSGNFADGKYGFSITLPFMIDVWLDMFERTTAPVINTSYRFGAFDFGFIYRLDAPLEIIPKPAIFGFLNFSIYNWALRLSLFKHECTHIGDELAIRRKDLGLPITRVNVSYNYMELFFTLNDPDSSVRLNHGFRFGFLLNYKFKDGWYDFIETEAQAGVIEPSQIPCEIYLQYQFQSNTFSRGFQIIASVEYRLRERYKYPFSYSGNLNDYLKNNPDILKIYNNRSLVNCFNFFGGIRYNNPKANYFSKIGIGARYYFGINPYGQFRSIPNYSQWGIAVIFE